MPAAEVLRPHSHSLYDLPVGRGAGNVPPADECHPACWLKSSLINTDANGTVANTLGRLPFKTWIQFVGSNDSDFTVDTGASSLTEIAYTVTIADIGVGRVQFYVWAI